MQQFKKKIIVSSVVAVIGGLLVPSVALAQLEEVVVTAQKRTEALKDVPLAITAVQSEQLENAGVKSVSGLTQTVPGLRVDASGGFTQPTVRGVGSAIAGTGMSANVATYIDGFYNPSQLTTDAMFLNLESVEVLKGPQGTLFGRNATGGAILMKLREPTFTPTIQAKASYARYNKQDYAIYGSSGITDTIAFDLGASVNSGDGFVKNVYTGKHGDDSFDNWSARGSVLWNPLDAVSFKLAIDHADHDDGRPYATGAIFDKGRGVPASIGAIIPGAIVATDRGDVSNSAETVFKAKSDGYYLTGNFDLGFADLTSYTMYREEKIENHLDLDSSSFPAFEGAFYNEAETITQEFNLTGDLGDLEYVLGAYFFKNNDAQNPFPVVQGGAPARGLYHAWSNTKAYAVFADGTYQFADKWYLIAGLRYGKETAEAMFKLDPLGLDLYGTIPSDGVPFDGDWENVSPRIGVRYEVTDNANIYFMYSEGYKSGLLTPNSYSTIPLKPENISSYEIGYKYSGGNNRLDTSVFYYDYQDLQVANYVNGAAIYRNAATSEIYGADLQWTSLITEGLELSLGAAYTHARYDKFPNSPSFIADVSLPPTASYGTYVATDVDASGARMQRSPDWTANIGLRYEKSFSFGSMVLSGNYFYTSEFPWDASDTFKEDAYGLMNLKAGWTDPSERWEVAVFGTNVLDEKYHTQVLPGPVAIQQTYGEPASYGVSVGFKY